MRAPERPGRGNHTDPAQELGRLERWWRSRYRAVRPTLRTVWAVLWFGGLRFGYRLRQDRGGAGLRVLMYHRISEVPSTTDHELEVRPSAFDRQLRLIHATGRSIIDLRDLLAPTLATVRGVLITFDDGHRDNLTRAAPILERYGATAVLFLVTGYTDNGQPYPWLGRPPGGSGLDDAGLPLTWSEVRELATRGWSIQAHGVSHRDLAHLSPAAVAEEMTRSSEAITAHVGARPIAFSYPFGSTTPETVRLAQAAGYSLQFGAGGGPPLRRRTPVDRSDNLLVFRAKLDGAFDIPVGRGLKRRLRGLLRGLPQPARPERSPGPERQ